MAMKKTTTKTKQAAEHPDHAGGSVTTIDPGQIKAWAEARGGKPASVEGTERSGEDVGLIRLEFPDAANANDAHLNEITWDEFFEKFDASGLALVYQEETAEGQRSNFNKLVKRETAAAATPAKRPAAKKAAKTATPAKATTAKKTTAKKAAKKGTPVAKTTAKKSTPAAKKAAPAAKKTVAKKSTAKKAAPTAKKAPAAKKTAAKKSTAKKTTAKKVPAARGYRGR